MQKGKARPAPCMWQRVQVVKEVTHWMRVDASVGHNLCPEAMKSLFRWLHQHCVVVAGEQSLAKDRATIMIVGH